jgi:hypothetical protein
MKSNLKDRFTVSFYDETYNDKILLEALNRMCQPRFRGNKLKELALIGLKVQMPDIIKEVEKILNNDINKEVAITKQKNTRKKSAGIGLAGLTVVTSDDD